MGLLWGGRREKNCSEYVGGLGARIGRGDDYGGVGLGLDLRGA